MGPALKKPRRRVAESTRQRAGMRPADGDAEFRKLLEAMGLDAANLKKSKYAFGLPAETTMRLTPQSLARIARALRPA